jgi:hypothetical protein
VLHFFQAILHVRVSVCCVKFGLVRAIFVMADEIARKDFTQQTDEKQALAVYGGQTLPEGRIPAGSYSNVQGC